MRTNEFSKDRLWEQALTIPLACMDKRQGRRSGYTDLRRELHLLSPGSRGDIWTEHAGIAVRDRFGTYRSQLPEETDHGFCNAYLLRNQQEIDEWNFQTGWGWGEVHEGESFLMVGDTKPSMKPLVRSKVRILSTELKQCLTSRSGTCITMPWPGRRDQVGLSAFVADATCASDIRMAVPSR